MIAVKTMDLTDAEVMMNEADVKMTTYLVSVKRMINLADVKYED